MKEVREKLEITIVAFGDAEGDNEDENDEEDTQTVLYNEIGSSDEEKRVDGKISENNLSLELQKFGYDADDADLLLEMLPEASLEEANENLLEEGHELCDPKNKNLSHATKDIKARKVKFNDDLCRTRQPRLCEIHKNSSDKLSLSNKPLIVANEQLILSSKDSVNGEENENRNRNANTNDEVGYPSQGKRVPVKMRSVNMFNSVLPSSASSLLKSSTGLKDKNLEWSKTNGWRNRVIPVWIKNKPFRKKDFDNIQVENFTSIKSIAKTDQNDETSKI